MKKAIALWGLADSGKTSTLKIVHGGLSKLAERSIEKFRISEYDMRDVFVINGIKVGIETKGDPGSRLEESLNLFKKEGCKLIICACRTKGQTTDWVNSLAPLYTISWRGQSSVSIPELRDESNRATAAFILKEAKAVIY
jgi:hypothetical protein